MSKTFTIHLENKYLDHQEQPIILQTFKKIQKLGSIK